MKYLHNNEIDAYIPDNHLQSLLHCRHTTRPVYKFRSRDLKFQHQKIKHPKPSRAKPKDEQTIPADEFVFDEKQLSCQCPEGEMPTLRRQKQDKKGNAKAFFEGKVSQCRHCKRKHECMRNPTSSNQSNGRGRQVSFIIQRAEQPPNFTDWMKERVDSKKGKQIYGHRMSVIDNYIAPCNRCIPTIHGGQPVFGNIEFNKNLNRFSVRGKTKVQDQWRLAIIAPCNYLHFHHPWQSFCLVHNIEKIMNYGKLAA